MAAPSVSGGVTLLAAWNAAAGAAALDNSGTRATATAAGLDGVTNAARCVAGPTAGTKYGHSSTFTSVDLTTSRRMVHQHNAARGMELIVGLQNVQTSDGWVFTLFSNGGTVNFKRWIVGGKDHIPNHQKYLATSVDVQSTSNYTSGGAFDGTAVTRVEMHATKDAAGSHQFNTSLLAYSDPFLAINGETGDRGGFSDILAAQDTIVAGTQIFIAQTESQILCLAGWGAGDSSTLTWFDESNKSWEFPQAAVVADKRMQLHSRDNQIGFEIDGSGSDTFLFSNCSWTSVYRFYWNILTQSGDTATFTGCTVRGCGDVTIDDEADFTGCVFDDCNEITAGSPNLTDCTISNGNEARAITLTGTASISNLILQGNTNGINIGTIGTYVFDNHTYSGNTFDFENSSTGLITINVINGGGTPTVTNTGIGATTVINNTRDLTVDGILSGDSVAVYRSTGAGATTILDTEFQVGVVGSGNNQSADSTILLAAQTRTVSPLSSDVPSAGVLRIEDPNISAGSGAFLRFPYSSVDRVTNIFTLASGTIGTVTSSVDLRLSDDSFVSFLEETSAGTSVTNALEHISDIPLLIRVRAEGILPYEATGTFTSSGAVVTAIRTTDSIRTATALVATYAFTKDDEIIEVASPATEISLQDLLNAIRKEEATLDLMDIPSLVIADGKKTLPGLGIDQAITLDLLNDWRVKFADRAGPTFVKTIVRGGSIIATNSFGNDPIAPGAFVSHTASAAHAGTATSDISGAVWDSLTSDHVISGSFGEKVGLKLLTLAKFLGLK